MLEAIFTTIRQQHLLAQQTIKWIGMASHLANNFEAAPYRDKSVTKTTTYNHRKVQFQRQPSGLTLLQSQHSSELAHGLSEATRSTLNHRLDGSVGSASRR